MNEKDFKIIEETLEMWLKRMWEQKWSIEEAKESIMEEIRYYGANRKEFDDE